MYRVIDNFLSHLQDHIPEINPSQTFHINVGQFIQGEIISVTASWFMNHLWPIVLAT